MREFLEQLKAIGKMYYTISDLMKVTKLSSDSLYVLLSRYVRKKTIIRLTSGVYILPEQYSRLDAIANALYAPSYLSFETALSRHGIISQIPYTLTFATTQKSMRKILGETEVEYRKVQPSLFFGYEKHGELFLATPEKALLDTAYLISFGKSETSLTNLDLKEVNFTRVKTLAKKFPLRTQKLIDSLHE